jgi:hypothetical protein
MELTKRQVYYQKNKEHLQELQRKYYKLNYEKRKERNREFRLRRQFGLPLGEHKLLLEKQNYTCPICHRHQKDLPRNLSLDHCHTTGQIRGLLCLNCNAALGHTRDSITILKEMINYLKKYNA